MLPPNAMGTITWLAPAGNYTIEEPLIEVEFNGDKHKYQMLTTWPVRKARPIIENLPTDTPTVTGLRVLDSLFPYLFVLAAATHFYSLAFGGTCAMPGAFGCGKTVVTMAMCKYVTVDVAVYVKCGERGNELTDQILDFPMVLSLVEFGVLTFQMQLDFDGKRVSIAKRTCTIANTSNMSVAAREASIYTGWLCRV